MFSWQAVARRAQLDVSSKAARQRHQEEFFNSLAKPPLPPDARKVRPSINSRAEHRKLDDEFHSDSGSDSEVSLVLSESTQGSEGLESPQAEPLEAEVDNVMSPRDVLIADLQMKCALLETEGFQLREKVLQLEAEREQSRAAAAAAQDARGMGSPASSSRSSSPACSPASCVLLCEAAKASEAAEAKPSWLAEAELSGPEEARSSAVAEEGLAELWEASETDLCGAGQDELSGASVFLAAEAEPSLEAEQEPASETSAADAELCREPGAKCCFSFSSIPLREAEAENSETQGTGVVLIAETCEAAEVAATVATPLVEKQSLLSYLPPAMERSRPNSKSSNTTGGCKPQEDENEIKFSSENVIPACPAGHGPLSLVSSAVPWICDTCDNFYKYSNHGFVEPRYLCSQPGCSFANSCKECAILNTAAWYGEHSPIGGCSLSESDPSSSSIPKVSSDRISDSPLASGAVLSQARPESPRGLAPLPHPFDSKVRHCCLSEETVPDDDETPATSATGSTRSCSPIRQVSSQVYIHGDLENSSGSSQPSTSARSVGDPSSIFGCSQHLTPRTGATAQIVRQRSIRMPATHESYQFAFNELALPLMKSDLGSAYSCFEGVNALFSKIHGVPCGSALYNMACCLSMGSSANPTVPGAAGLPPHCPVDDIVSARLELAAMLLQSAVGAGYTDIPHMLTDPDLHTLRQQRPFLLGTFWQQLEAQKATLRPTVTCARANAPGQSEARVVLA